MKITRKNLDDAAGEKIITAEQAAKLHDYLKNLPTAGPAFDFTNVRGCSKFCVTDGSKLNVSGDSIPEMYCHL